MMTFKEQIKKLFDEWPEKDTLPIAVGANGHLHVVPESKYVFTRGHPEYAAYCAALERIYKLSLDMKEASDRFAAELEVATDYDLYEDYFICFKHDEYRRTVVLSPGMTWEECFSAAEDLYNVQ